MIGKSSYIKDNGSNFILGWIGITAISTVVGIILGMAIAMFFFCSQIVFIEVMGAVILGSMIGLSIGYAQSLHVHVLMHEYKRWIYSSVIGWAFAIFLVEINYPISRCIGSSNAPRYTPGELIEYFQDQYLLLAGLIEKMITGEMYYGNIYYTTEGILIFALIGICLGLPQGIAQWWAIKNDLSRSSILILVNILTWILAVTGGIYLGGGMRLIFLGLSWVLILPGLTISITLVWLRRRKMVDPTVLLQNSA